MHLPFQTPSAKPSDATGPIHSARRLLVLLASLVVLGTVLGALSSAFSNRWTYQALQNAEAAANALRFYGDVDQLQDALYADVLTAATLPAVPNEFERHAQRLEANLQRLAEVPLPAHAAAEIQQLVPALQAYVEFGRDIVQDTTSDRSPARIARFNAEWTALELPLTQVSNELQTLAQAAQQSGRTSYHDGILLRILCTLVIAGALLFASRGISIAILDSSRQLAAATEEARRASRIRAEFLAAMSHEIRTPLTGVLGMVDLLAADELTPQQREYVDAVHASGRHLLNVINDILDFTRLESGRLELEHIDFSLPDLLGRVHSVMHPLAVERGLSLHVGTDAALATVVKGDPTRIKQVLLNLAGNAIKFTEKGSVSVYVGLRPHAAAGLHCRFEVRDTGIGIAPGQQSELFSAFRQADQTIARRFGGSGLGLAICKRLVEAMGGSIGVESAPGCGSTFFFELPLEAGSALAPAAHGPEPFKPMQPRRILVAEDVKINRDILAATLRRAGHVLTFANDGALAVALAARERFDLVLMDIQMPVMDGMEATRRIRAGGGPNSAVPIIALTANVMAQERERYLSTGMSHCVTKPIDWKQLFEVIERCAPGRDAQPAEPELAAQGEEAAAALPLIEDGVLAALGEMAGADGLREILQTALRGYGKSLAVLAGQNVAGAEVRAEAHKMRGSGGTLGLARISGLAAQIEEAAAQGAVQRPLIEELRQAFEATREELAKRGLLAARGGVAA